MQFTRQPVIETIITPKEGYRLMVRGAARDRSEYLVDALELILFGTIPFYRSLEGLRPFLVPAADFEIEQVRESRTPLKHATYERAKTAKEAPHRETRKAPSPGNERPKASKAAEPAEGEGHWERRKRSRRRRTPEESQERTAPAVNPALGSDIELSPEISASMPSPLDLVPPPSRLVSDMMQEGGRERDLEPQRGNRKPSPHKGPPTRDVSSLEAVEAILRSSAPPLPEAGRRTSLEDQAHSGEE